MVEDDYWDKHLVRSSRNGAEARLSALGEVRILEEKRAPDKGID